MKIIQPSVELIDDIQSEKILAKLERCGRIVHRSECDDTENFIREIIKSDCESILEHVSLTFRIICDYATQNELVRHRHISFTVESTQCCTKYDELIVIEPQFWKYDVMSLDKNTRGKAQIQQGNWYEAMTWAEDCYRTCLTGGKFYEGWGMPPEVAHVVLPLCLAAELYMTVNLYELRRILKLWTIETAHSQMQFIAEQILKILREKLPIIVEDIKT